ncbi:MULTISPECIES: helix-turn-helix transcriptional regulator [unclassified Acinetobacter]|uniref:helix-turn-helix transcriptional regulator n=1 Tax=unclassified Acinetobacter TaxID=196816 RepID=UPI0024487EAB|nr:MULTISPECIES: helix-turn-helix transcriptional regulator [unclassified Acinetobacter]MDH0031209.1 LuxR C-terminal-related transcriptional regulator [Acinetobacter sp. GD04021]MDH0886954.1 LuxR C-terminal-related transcriptional regulator [Acinetobacter sp. GD03873]MDH1083405.1 LuxR C-terminal-related transcriptional regulator [Acinetobacter sp. GD03983]MDH2190270.1 LuxR C-terminal-related transcriptional regulator [Acinetobacter sp. GD03645]MDH2203787.1 LuxR C-terminal-related transcription
MLAEQENKVIGMIYEAALNPALWQDVLTEIVDFTGSTTAIFTATDQLSPNYDFVFTHNIPPESMRAYQDEQVKVLDMRLHAPYWAEKTLGDTVLNTFAHYAAMPAETDEFLFYEKCAKPTNVSHVAAVLLERSAYSWAVFAVHRSPQLNEYSEQEEKILKRLGVHLRRALQIYRQMTVLQEDKKNIYQVLDRFKIGVILINQDYRLCYANAIVKKIFEKSSILELDKNNSLKTLKNFQEKLNQLIRSALFENDDLNNEAGGVLALYDDNDSSLMLSILPFSETETQYHQKQAIIFLTQTNQAQYLAKDYLIQKYKLAKRELEVCDLFVNGLSLEQIAEHMDITYGSIRVYIKNIFAKTGCTSQTELMQLLMGVTLEFEHI